MTSVLPYWVGIGTAIDLVPGMDNQTLLHAGPPIKYRDMPGAMQGAVKGALLFEHKAQNAEGAHELALSGEVKFYPNHDHACVLPMCGILSPHMPVCVIEDPITGRRAYTSLCDDDDGGIKFGEFDEPSLAKLRWVDDVLAPHLSELLEKTGPVDLARIMNAALDMGDDLHLRTKAAGLILVRELLKRARVLSFDAVHAISQWGLVDNSEHFLNFAMAACKLACDAASGIENSSIVTAISRNGYETGIKIAAFPDIWFTAPSSEIDGIYQEGFSAADAAKDMGDSAIMEVLGFGGGIFEFSPDVVHEVGMREFGEVPKRKSSGYRSYMATHPYYRISIDTNFGLPIGIDVSKIDNEEMLPLLTTAIAHKDEGYSQIGVGTSRPPLSLYTDAWEYYKAHVGC